MHPRAGLEPATSGLRSIRDLRHRRGWNFWHAQFEQYPEECWPGNKRLRKRRSTSELPELALRAGLEPATTGLTGEVSAPYTTGQGGSCKKIPKNCAGEWAKRVGSEPLLCGAFRFGTTPPPRRAIGSGRDSGPARPCCGSNSLLSPPALTVCQSELETRLSRPPRLTYRGVKTTGGGPLTRKKFPEGTNEDRVLIGYQSINLSTTPLGICPCSCFCVGSRHQGITGNRPTAPGGRCSLGSAAPAHASSFAFYVSSGVLLRS